MRRRQRSHSDDTRKGEVLHVAKKLEFPVTNNITWQNMKLAFSTLKFDGNGRVIDRSNVGIHVGCSSSY